MNQHRPNARDERGFSMFIVIMALLVTSMFVAAAYAAANGDLPMSGGSKDRKSTYAAAEAGLNFYSYHLNQDSDYWTRCDQVPAPNGSELNPVNQRWDGNGVDPRRWRNVPGSDAQYTIELLPATGFAQCIVGNQRSIIDLATGTFKMRFTGRPSPDSPIRRSIVSTFRRGGFLDYLYFTDFENLDPQAEATSAERTAALANCANRYRAARPASANCTEIQFITGDRTNGPFHTNDDILTCGTPIFGRNATDRVEFSGPDPGWRRGGGCSGSPNFLGTVKTAVKKLVLPTTNDELRTAAQSGGNVYTGTTHIRLNTNNTMTVRTGAAPQNPNTVPIPGNGVVYVATGVGGCSITNPPPVANYATEPRSCGNLYISGTYSESLTFGADNDIIVGSDYDPTQRDLVKASGADGVVGLIAKNFVRVYHRVNRTSSTCTNSFGASDVTIEAAILSLQHSFIADNFRCGAPLGDLHVTGAIAQKYRGTVGRHSGGTPVNGFLKDYTYDDRLRFRSPPFFLPPVDAAWTVLRRNEQVPAR